MRTQQYIQVETIVVKYENLASNTEAAKKTREYISGYFIPEDISRLCLVEQLLARIYQLRAGNDANESVVKKYSCEASYYVMGLLSKEEEQFLVDNFAEFVDYALNHLCTVQTLGEIFDEPSEWSDLVPYLLGDNFRKVFVAHSNKGREFVGLGNCELTVCRGFEEAAIRALACGKSIKEYKTSETSHNMFFDLKEGQFDVAVVDIHTDDGWLGDNFSAEECFNACFRIVKDGGDILLCMSKEAIISEETVTMRSKLQDERLLQEVIQLPSGNILLHIVKESHDTFVMCDASLLSERSNERVVEVEAFKKEINMAGLPERDEHPLMRRYTYETLNKNMLLPAFYLHFSENGTPIADLCCIGGEMVLSDECQSNEQVVTVNHLSNVFTKGEFNVADLLTLQRDRLRRYYRVNGPAVIMAVSEQDIAIGYTTDSNSFLVPRNMYVLKPTDNVDVRYLAGKLLSSSVKEQVVSMVYGKGFKAKLATIWAELVRIDLLPMLEQQQFIQKVILEDYAMQERSATKQEQGFTHAIRLRKHALAQNISAFDSLFRSLEYCMNEHKGHLKESEQISPISPMTVGEAMEILHSDLETICYRVDHLTDDNDWGKSVTIEPQQFIEEYERKHQNVAFSFSHLWEPFETNTFSKDVFDKKTGKLLFHKGESMNAAWVPRKALQQVFDNIVANAREHGFKDKCRNDYVIQTTWNTDGLNMLIKISNNGVPLPEDVNTNLVLEYGYSTALNQNGHGGIGGGEIAEIMRKFGGDITVVSTPQKKFTVTYILTMPLASLY